MKVGAMVGTCAHCGALMVVKTDLPSGFCPACGQWAFGVTTVMTGLDIEATQAEKRRVLGENYQTAEEFFRDNEDPRD